MLVVLIRGLPSCKSCKSFKLDEKATRGGQVPAQKVKSRGLIIHMEWAAQRAYIGFWRLKLNQVKRLLQSKPLLHFANEVNQRT